MCVLAVLVLEVLAQMMSSKQELTAVSLLKGQFFLRLILGIALYYNRSANEEMSATATAIQFNMEVDPTVDLCNFREYNIPW